MTHTHTYCTSIHRWRSSLFSACLQPFRLSFVGLLSTSIVFPLLASFIRMMFNAGRRTHAGGSMIMSRMMRVTTTTLDGDAVGMIRIILPLKRRSFVNVPHAQAGWAPFRAKFQSSPMGRSSFSSLFRTRYLIQMTVLEADVSQAASHRHHRSDILHPQRKNSIIPTSTTTPSLTSSTNHKSSTMGRNTREESSSLLLPSDNNSSSSSSSKKKNKNKNKNQWRITPTVHDASGAPRNARAIIVLIGWWGAKPQHLDKYASLYQEILPSAVIVAGTASPFSILVKHEAKLREFAREGLGAIASSLAEYENLHLPVLVHVFSNGGGFVWQHMVECLEDQEDAALERQFRPYFHSLRTNFSVSSFDTEETPLHTNTAFSLMRKNIRGQIFDSSPAYPKFDNGIAALEGSGMVGNRLLLGIFKCLFILGYLLESFWDRIHHRPHRLMQYWKDLIECDWDDVPQGFIYSSVDRMVDPDHLEEFIEARKKVLERGGSSSSENLRSGVSTLKFEDSPHVMHYRYHPVEYKEFVEQFLQRHLLRVSSKLRR